MQVLLARVRTGRGQLACAFLRCFALLLLRFWTWVQESKDDEPAENRCANWSGSEWSQLSQRPLCDTSDENMSKATPPERPQLLIQL